jgi:carbonic anhydrase/acetyltransferase-like protein (isoleucine patch superfamily)
MIALGVPAKVRREVTAEERERFRAGVEHYVERAEIYRGEA